jgi:cytochrome c oxidase subunit 4
MDVDTMRPTLRRQARTFALAWVALLTLMFTSLASAYVKLGVFNLVAGLVIATLKSGIVAWIFMRLSKASALLRLIALAGIGAWGLLVVLSGVDYLTRPVAPAPVERPQQLMPPRPDRAVSP